MTSSSSGSTGLLLLTANVEPLVSPVAAASLSGSTCRGFERWLIAIGCNNWQHLGSDDGGRRAAIIYSLLATCRKHGVNPFEYLRDVLDRVSTHPASAVADLLPQNWKPLPSACAISN